MISPTPPRARSAKYSASRSVSRARSSRPVCIEPMTTRLRSVVKPRSNGDNRFGYGLLTGARCQCRAELVEPVHRPLRRNPPRSTRYVAGLPETADRRTAVRSSALRAGNAARTPQGETRRPPSGFAGDRPSAHRAAAPVSVRRSAGPVRRARSDTVYTSCPAGPAATTGVSVHPAVVLHGPQRSVDLLMAWRPRSEPMRPVEPPGELVAGAGLLAQRHAGSRGWASHAAKHVARPALRGARG